MPDKYLPAVLSVQPQYDLGCPTSPCLCLIILLILQTLAFQATVLPTNPFPGLLPLRILCLEDRVSRDRRKELLAFFVVLIFFGGATLSSAQFTLHSVHSVPPKQGSGVYIVCQGLNLGQHMQGKFFKPWAISLALKLPFEPRTI